ncbi:unnamed protein product, partial [Nesidiocoris tenuis]
MKELRILGERNVLTPHQRDCSPWKDPDGDRSDRNRSDRNQPNRPVELSTAKGRRSPTSSGRRRDEAALLAGEGGGAAPTMAAAVNQPRSKFSGAPGGDEPEEDIAAIAKQISDHAEAIYQNWKSRGLAPTEILTCNNVAVPDKFAA